MVSVKERGLLINIIKHCKRIEEKMVNVDKSTFDANDDIKDVICFNLLQIGELVKGFDSKIINEYRDIPWNKVKGMRDRIAHGYGNMDMSRVWTTAYEDVKPLREYCERILNENK